MGDPAPRPAPAPRFGSGGIDTTTRRGQELLYLSFEWMMARSAAKARDGHRCADCGGASRRLEVHHVLPLAQGGAPLDPDNLLTLCHPCHMARHQRPVER